MTQSIAEMARIIAAKSAEMKKERREQRLRELSVELSDGDIYRQPRPELIQSLRALQKTPPPEEDYTLGNFLIEAAGATSIQIHQAIELGHAAYCAKYLFFDAESKQWLIDYEKEKADREQEKLALDEFTRYRNNRFNETMFERMTEKLFGDPVNTPKGEVISIGFARERDKSPLPD